MRLRLEREKDHTAPPELAFKTAAGGLLDAEFFAQLQQMLHGPGRPLLRVPSTRRLLRELLNMQGASGDELARLLENYNFVKRIEMLVRRDTGEPRTALPADCSKVARWIGFPDTEGFMTEHRARLRETRELVLKLLHYNGER
jgi:glutamine synthetase adenylyltransferase